MVGAKPGFWDRGPALAGGYDKGMKSTSEILDLLEHVRTRKEMYLEHVTVEAVENFVTGFVVACVASEIPLNWETWSSSADERGWQCVTTKRHSAMMREHGLSEDEIVEELFQILFATVRRVLPMG